MTIASQIAKHIRDVHFGGNWTSVNMKATLADVTPEQAVAKVHSFNTIATLVYHTNYYISAVLKVMRGGPLEAKDTYSFDHPPVQSQQDWEALLQKTWEDVEAFALEAEQLPDEKLGEVFIDEKYGTWYRNLQGIVEHTHYHLGQMVLIKKILVEG